MTVIAGIVGLRDGFSVSDEMCQDIRKAISRRPDEEIAEMRGDRYFLAKFDVGAFGSHGVHIDETGAITLLAGEPLLAGATRKRPRSVDLETLHRHWRLNDQSALKSARGAFCLAHFDPVSHHLELVADKIGLRSLYYYVSDDYVVFASALRVLETSRFVEKRMDVRGVAEIAAMRVALADRTPYAGIKLLKSGQIARFANAQRSSDLYWRWDTVRPSAATTEELLREAYRIFTEAVRLRLGDDRAAIAFLSGGLDSRCIVTALKSVGAELYTYGIAVGNTLDHPLAERYAEAIDADYQYVSIPANGEFSPVVDVLPLLDAAAFKAEARPERPRVIWSGEGGSGIVGCVSQTAELLKLLRQGRSAAATELYLTKKKQGLPRKLFARSVSDLICDIPKNSLQERLRAFECADPGRAISLFDLIDYQSRHLNEHYEDIDLTRAELETPFYDSEFVALMYSASIDTCLYHEFYHKWLAEFPPVVVSVPWQTYPGHLPCPLPLPDGFQDQWSTSQQSEWLKRRAHLQVERLERTLAGAPFPHPILDKLALVLTRWTVKLGMSNYGYILTKAVIFSKYWTICGGRYVLPEQDPMNAGP